MAFERIERVGPAPTSETPPNGLLVASKSMTIRKTGNTASFITIRVGAELARKASFHQEAQPVAIEIGTGNDTGKIAIAVDLKGDFVARGKPGKAYQISINAKSAEGLFALKFDKFSRDNIEVLKPVMASRSFSHLWPQISSCRRTKINLASKYPHKPLTILVRGSNLFWVVGVPKAKKRACGAYFGIAQKSGLS